LKLPVEITTPFLKYNLPELERISKKAVKLIFAWTLQSAFVFRELKVFLDLRAYASSEGRLLSVEKLIYRVSRGLLRLHTRLYKAFNQFPRVGFSVAIHLICFLSRQKINERTCTTSCWLVLLLQLTRRADWKATNWPLAALGIWSVVKNLQKFVHYSEIKIFKTLLVTDVQFSLHFAKNSIIKDNFIEKTVFAFPAATRFRSESLFRENMTAKKEFTRLTSDHKPDCNFMYWTELCWWTLQY